MDSERESSPYTREQTCLTASEKIASLFQPDTLLSAQYFDDRRRKAPLEPVKRLMLAILEDAINCFQDNHRARCGKSKRLFDEAREWIFGVSDWVFGFENICSALGFEPQYIRAGLLRWKEKELAKHPSAGLWKKQRSASGKKHLPKVVRAA
ncbi:MAG: hypothetical protein DME76_00210 [Verrucomicrobia bacterium]|jgi:hypothetical protein|nr:MAG: hypothetical protein DME76_00210 [Verrucomicrobiota bacterium]